MTDKWFTVKTAIILLEKDFFVKEIKVKTKYMRKNCFSKGEKIGSRSLWKQSKISKRPLS